MMGKRKSVSLRWKIAGLAALTCVAGGVAGAAVLMPKATPPVSDKVLNYKPEPLPEVKVTGVAIIGDSYTAGTPFGGQKDANWTQLTRAAMITKTSELYLQVSGKGGAGYAEPGTEGTTVPTEVPKVVADYTKLVVIFGSRNDINLPPERVQAAAAATYKAVKTSAPKAKLLVIGVPWTSEVVPPFVQATDDSIHAAATAAGATFVDPLEEGWFFGADAALIGKDKIHPTDEGHAYLAKKITPYIKKAVAGL
jgi:lysophospholipase L1-like esterase